MPAVDECRIPDFRLDGSRQRFIPSFSFPHADRFSVQRQSTETQNFEPGAAPNGSPGGLLTKAFHDYTIHFQPCAASESRWVSLAFERKRQFMGKRWIQRSGSKQSPISIIPESFRQAGLLLSSIGAVPAAGSRFQRSAIHAHGFIQSRQWMNVGFQISDFAYHVTGLFLARPFATQSDSTSSGNRRKPKNSNQALHPTALRAGC